MIPCVTPNERRPSILPVPRLDPTSAAALVSHHRGAATRPATKLSALDHCSTQPFYLDRSSYSRATSIQGAIPSPTRRHIHTILAASSQSTFSYAMSTIGTGDIAATGSLPEQLEQMAAHLHQVAQQYRAGIPQDSSDEKERRRISEMARTISTKANPPWAKVDGILVAIAETAAMRLFSSWNAFQRIPADGSISYAALAVELGADSSLVGTWKLDMSWFASFSGLAV